MTTIYCKAKDREGRGEVASGLEISKGINRNDSSNDPIRAEGRVFLRFFATDQPKEQHIRTMLEPWEAFQLSQLIRQAVESREKVELRLAPHKFTRDGEMLRALATAQAWQEREPRD